MLLNKLDKMLSNGLCVWCLVYFLIVMDLANTKVVYGHPSSDFSKHSIVKPKLQHVRTKRGISSTKIQDSTGSHHPEVTLTVSIDGEEHELDLRLNEALVPSGHSLSFQQGGQTRVHRPEKEELDICQYSGRVRDKPGSWAAVSTCRGVRGVLYDGQRLRYIEPVDDNNLNGEHFLYAHEHLTRQYHCGNPDGPAHNSSAKMAEKWLRNSRYKRNVESPELRMPSSANQRSRYVELVLVADHDEYVANGRDVRAVHRHVMDLTNIIHSVYAPLNIFIALVGVEVWTEHDKMTIVEGANAGDVLSDFRRYRSTELINLIHHDNAHLLTRKSFDGNIVGRAYVGGMCSSDSLGVNNDHSLVVGLVAMTIAHEMGHNFGMHHDKEDCKCADKKCIMSNTSTNAIPERWSSCSLQYLSLSFEKGLDHCLRNKPKNLFSSPTCGNGFLEEGEQCDCGIAPGDFVPEGFRACRACCNPDCTLRANATCAHGQCCDLPTCSPKAIGTECRAATLECDLPEFCNGTSPFCPRDVLKMDATPCGNEKAYCVRGSCRSHTDQCRLLWGVTGKQADDDCYNYNTKGDAGGNCGYKRATDTYVPCAKENVKCGKLQCSHLSQKLEYSNFVTATLASHYPIINSNKGILSLCRAVVIDLGTSDDPSLVPDGAKCGQDKMCMQQRCLPVEEVGQMVKPEGSVCPSNCSGHGVCNSNGNCHCEPGYAPPLCALPGPGGSYDSGPIVDTTDLWRFMVAMYIIFLGIVPAIALILLLIYCRRHGPCWKRNEHHYEKPTKPNIRSKFALPNFLSFEWLKKDKMISCNTANSQPRRVNTKREDIEVHVYSSVSYGVVNKNVNNTAPAPATQTNTEEPMTLNSKLKKEVVAENCLYNAPIHNTANNLDVEFKPKISEMKNKFETLSVQNLQKSYSVSPNFKDLNKELSLLKNNNGSPINRPKQTSVMTKPNLHLKPSVNQTTDVSPKLNISQKPSVSTKPSVSVKPDVSQKLSVPKPVASSKPGLSPKANRLPRENKARPEIINAGLAFTTNEYLNQRSNLRKVGNIKDVNK